MTTQQSRLIWLLIVAVLAWGIYHAVGAYVMYRPNNNPYRAVVVLVCVLAYLGFWLLLLKRRQSRVNKQANG
jgi:hypothetical protein